jgi:2,4-dienoyl-CoA reductase (NADPH2)
VADFGKRVVIIGGGFAGCEMTDVLLDKGKKITLLEEGPKIGYDVGQSNIWMVKQKIKETGTVVATNVKVLEITKKGVRAKVSNEDKFFEADTVAMALPLLPNDKLSKELEKKGFVVRTIGDASTAGKIMEAVLAGLKASYEI